MGATSAEGLAQATNCNYQHNRYGSTSGAAALKTPHWSFYVLKAFYLLGRRSGAFPLFQRETGASFGAERAS
jgi:hypothetical protein